MRVTELKALARERGLRGYSQMRKPEIIKLIRNNQQSWAPDIPPSGVQPPSGALAAPVGICQHQWAFAERGPEGPCSTRNGYI